MECGASCIKYLLFIFNFCFVLGGLALLIPGIIVETRIGSADGISADQIGQIEAAAIALIIIGSIIFVIAFFGCCGAIRESHCMVVTFAVLLLTILVIQVGIAIYAFVTLNKVESNVITDEIRKSVRRYWTSTGDRNAVDFAQEVFHCCGAASYQEYLTPPGNGTIPWSCCKQDDKNNKFQFCNGKDIYLDGCGAVITDTLRKAGKVLGGIALGIAAVELTGIVFALCLANSIRNENRRNYRV